MSLFKLNAKRLKSVEEIPFKLERDIQHIVEANLEEIFSLKFIDTEFALNNLRIDTLAFDEETKSFVIIEYKRDKNSSVIDQGYTYLSLLVNNKADFILQYNESEKCPLRRDEVDWTQSRVIFMSSQFNKFQRKAIEFKDLPIELWEIKKYENNLILFSQIKPVETSESIKTVTRDKTMQDVANQVKSISIDDHFKKGWDNSHTIFEDLCDRILALDSRLNAKSLKHYIGFSVGKRNMVSVRIYKSKIGLVFSRTEPKDLKDPENRVKYEKDSYKYYNQHLSVFSLNSTDDIDYAIFLTKQVHKKYFK